MRTWFPGERAAGRGMDRPQATNTLRACCSSREGGNQRQKKKAARSGAALLFAPKAQFAFLVPGYEVGFFFPVTVDGRSSVVGRRLDGVERDQAVDRLFAEHVLAVELGHLGVF